MLACKPHPVEDFEVAGWGTLLCHFSLNYQKLAAIKPKKSQEVQATLYVQAGGCIIIEDILGPDACW
jgi:hypothetical protein